MGANHLEQGAAGAEALCTWAAAWRLPLSQTQTEKGKQNGKESRHWGRLEETVPTPSKKGSNRIWECCGCDRNQPK